MNKIFLIGNLTKDPELRVTQSGAQVCSFGLAVNRRKKVDGQPDADFFTITAWRQLAEHCAQYLAKGRKVCVTGAVQLRTYEDRDGVKRSCIDVQADDVEFLPSAQAQGEMRAMPATQASVMPRPVSSPALSAHSGFTQVDEDELPF